MSHALSTITRIAQEFNHGEPAPLTLASRCGSVRSYRPGEYTTTPGPVRGCAAIGTYLCDKTKTDTNECWWCNRGEPQSRHHLFVEDPKVVEGSGKGVRVELPEGAHGQIVMG